LTPKLDAVDAKASDRPLAAMEELMEEPLPKADAVSLVITLLVPLFMSYLNAWVLGNRINLSSVREEKLTYPPSGDIDGWLDCLVS
jgi:hypothetical protein